MTDKRGIGTLICDDIEMTTGNCDFFTPVMPENVLRAGNTIEINPQNSMSDSGPFEFHISRDPDHYIYLPMTRLFGCIKVLKSDGTDLLDTDAVTVCNLFPQSLFKQMEIEVEGTQINDISSSTYAIKAYLETILTYGTEAKSTHLQMAGWGSDTVGEENEVDSASAKKRIAMIIKKKEYYFSMILHCDFFQMERFLLPNTKVVLRMVRNADAYSMISATLKAKIQIDNLRLSIHKVRIAPDFDKAIESNLIKEPALYPLTQSKIKSFLLQSTISSKSIQNALTGSLPQSLVICFLDARAFDGNVAFNPFVFTHFNLNKLNLRVNGNPFHPRPFQPNYETGDFMREYRNLMDHGGVQHGNNSIAINMKEFVSNSNFYIYDFSPDLCNSYHQHTTKQGSIDIELGWSKPLTNNIYMLIYSSHKQTIVIDHNRIVSLLE